MKTFNKQLIFNKINKIRTLHYWLFLICVFTALHCQNNNKERIICNNTDKQKYFPEYKIYAFDNYEQGLNCSKYTNKPMIIYFNAYGIGTDIFSAKYSKDSELTSLINNEFVSVILTVDDQTKIENSDKTIGQINSEFEISLVDKTTQPTFVILNSQSKIISISDYEPNLGKFKDFLRNGLSEK